MRNAGLDELQAGIKIGGRNISYLRYAKDTTVVAESEEKLKNLLMRVKEESERPSLKQNIKKKQKTKNKNTKIWPHYFTANIREKSESSDRFPLLGLQNHCRW